MITVISPAKTLDFSKQSLIRKATNPDFLEQSSALVEQLRQRSAAQLGKLMGISPKLAELNHQRFQDWSLPFTPDNSKQALLAFKGDVYTGFDCEAWTPDDFNFAQKHLRILSGLYGLLRPLDLIQPYRLEMGTRLENPGGKDLYEFWGTTISDAIRDAAKKSKSKCLVNLASNEYFGSVKPELISIPVVTPVFKDSKNGKYKIISFFAKKARGMMSNFIVHNRITDPADLRGFDVAGYYFDEGASTEDTLVFLREEQM
ncbi:MAG: peroxide stress protein YaaA [Verrucomicrobiales bacterium]